MKIHIIGCSGSGKTFLAEKIAKRYSIHHYDLDNIYWSDKEKFGVRRPEEERTKILNDILLNNHWIIEGVYYEWLDDAFKDADYILVLKTNKRICQYRVIKRFYKRKWQKYENDAETLKSAINLAKWIDRFYDEAMPKIEEKLKPYNKKVIYLKNFKDVEQLLSKTINTYRY